ncbi:Fc.00g114950.m01.CDS01 [Cosmosporella sp. VM-42]
MSEHWKSTPKYWCKHCQCYVRDTKLERQNHEATGKHQGALKRFLRDLHRGHEREERDKERAQREIARLNGVVKSSDSGPGAPGPSAPVARINQSASTAPSEMQLKRQREQLAELGVAMPSDFRPEMAIPGEWTVTSTRVIKSRNEEEGEGSVEARATGVRKREETEEQKEEEEALRGLFKRSKKWGRDSKTMPQDEDKELDALLSGSTFQRPNVEEPEAEVKDDDGVDSKEWVKAEDDVPKHELDTTVKSEAPVHVVPVKSEVDTEPGLNPVVFKKRKPKNIRQK